MSFKISNVGFFFQFVYQGPGLAPVLEFMKFRPELMPNKVTDDEDKNKSSIELRLTEQLLIANKKMKKIYSSASIELRKRNVSCRYALSTLEDYQASIDRYRQKIQALQLETQENKTTHSVFSEFLKSGINLITNLRKFYLSANVTSRLRILGSIFPEKLVFEENKCRTGKINEAVRLMLATDKGFNEKGPTQIFENSALSPWVELRGIEPLSKHIRQKLSTCLFHYCLSVMNRK
jgi:hypothetical protein